MRQIQMTEVETEISKMINERREDILYCITDDVYIFNGTAGSVTEAAKQKYKIFELGQSGGTLVFAPGNIGIGMLQKDDGQKAQQLMRSLFNALLLQGVNPSWIGNDIVVEAQYKVISYGQLYLPDGYTFTTIQINLYTTRELVEEVCTKPILKIPRPLHDYGIDTELMLIWLMRCVHAVGINISGH
jgi:hypothetical protein